VPQRLVPEEEVVAAAVAAAGSGYSWPQDLEEEVLPLPVLEEVYFCMQSVVDLESVAVFSEPPLVALVLVYFALDSLEVVAAL